MKSAAIESSILMILYNRYIQKHRPRLVSGCVPCHSKIDEVYCYSMQESKKNCSSDSLIYHCDLVHFFPNGYVQNVITTCHLFFPARKNAIWLKLNVF